MSETPSIGGRIGSRVASIVSQGMVVTKQQMANHNVSLVMQMQDTFFRLVGSEIRRTIGEPMARIADHPKAPEWVRNTFGFLAKEHGQWQTFLASQVGGQALSVGLGSVLTNELSPVIQEIIAKNPNGLLDNGTLSQLVARRIASHSYAANAAARQGLDGRDFDLMVDAQQRDADIGSLMESFRRGNITGSRLIEGLKDAGIKDSAISMMVQLANTPLSAQDAANMVVRGIITQEQGRKVAEQSGIADFDFDRMVEAVGNPLSVQDLLFLYRRKKIDKARLEKGIRQGDTKNEWIDAAEMLGTVPMSTADAIAAAVQSQLPIPEAQKIAEENGLDPAHFQPLLNTAGDPLSRTEMIELWNRGEVSQAEVEQALREGRLKNKYIPAVLKLRRYVLPPDTIRMMYERGVIDKATALKGFAERGLNAEDSAAYLGLAKNVKTEKTRDLTESMIRTLYVDQAIGKDAAHKSLMNLGYDTDEADQLLAISDLERERQVQNQAISRVRARYVAHRIDETTAATALDKLEVPSGQRYQLIDTWTIERDLNTPSLTLAQMTSAVKKGIMQPADMAQRLSNLGYESADVTILMQLAGITPQGA